VVACGVGVACRIEAAFGAGIGVSGVCDVLFVAFDRERKSSPLARNQSPYPYAYPSTNASS